MKNPYIGITGFMRQEEVLEVFNVVPLEPERRIMVGVLASLKTMRGFQNKWPRRYPMADRISGIFIRHPATLNVIHYNAKELNTLCFQMLTITEFGGYHLHGLQLNIPWPPQMELQKYRCVFHDKQIILQIGSQAFQAVDSSPKQLAVAVKNYVGLIDYVLLDLSGGEGKLMDVAKIREYLQALKEKDLDIGIGIAGGLCPETLETIIPLIAEFPDISIDAEGRLRDQSDNLDLLVVKKYLRKAFALFI